MRQRLLRIRMKKGMYPSILFETLTSIQNQFLGPGQRLLADEIIAIVLDVATEEYRPCLTVKRKLNGDKLTVEDLERAMVEEYRQFTRSQFCKESSEGELLLFQFQGSCYNCGKLGHRANKCPNESSLKGTKEKNNNSGKFQGKCGTCGLKGHRSKDCWNKEENKDKRPANWKKKGQEKAAITVEKSEKGEEKSVEFGWVNDDLEGLLTNSNLLIADTGATVHSTSNKSLSSDWVEENDTVIVMGNGQKEDAVFKGSVKV
jgi:Zinc knuckle